MVVSLSSDVMASPFRDGGSVEASVVDDTTNAMQPTFFARSAPINGLRLYPQAPRISNLDDGRGAVTGGQRIDAMVYRVEQGGHYTLPAISVKWWDSRNHRLQTAQWPALTVEAQALSAYTPTFAIEQQHWTLSRQLLLWIASIAVLILAGYLLHVVWPRMARTSRKTWAALRWWCRRLRLLPLNPRHEKDLP